MKQSVFGLMQKHQTIDDQLQFEQARKVPDTLRITQLKKLKLAIRDRLHSRSLLRSFT